MDKFKKFFAILLGVLILFMVYDYFYTHYVPKTGNSDIEKEVNQKTDKKQEKPYTLNNAKVISLIGGKVAFPEIEKLMNSAKKTLFVEIFIFHYDTTGIRIANLLAKKKAEGVDVKVIVDATGLKFGKNDNKIVDLLKSKNVDIKVFNDKYISPTGLNLTHRKMIIADGERSMVGGMNFGKEYEYEWHDSMYLLKGEISQQLQKDFLYDWKRAGGEIPKNVISLKEGVEYGNVKMKVLKTNVTPDDVDHEYHREIHKAINDTKKEIYMESPYFSDDEIINDIIEAKKRGVKVTVIMPKHNNHSVFNGLNLYTANKFIEAGIDVYFYKPVFTHLKSYVFDDKTVIGSANIDERSFTGNQEIGVLVDNKEYAQETIEQVFMKDLKLSEKATKESVKINPAQKILIKSIEVMDYYL